MVYGNEAIDQNLVHDFYIEWCSTLEYFNLENGMMLSIHTVWLNQTKPLTWLQWHSPSPLKQSVGGAAVSTSAKPGSEDKGSKLSQELFFLPLLAVFPVFNYFLLPLNLQHEVPMAKNLFSLRGNPVGKIGNYTLSLRWTRQMCCV